MLGMVYAMGRSALDGRSAEAALSEAEASKRAVVRSLRISERALSGISDRRSLLEGMGWQF
jgi:hypothetical protein